MRPVIASFHHELFLLLKLCSGYSSDGRDVFKVCKYIKIYGKDVHLSTVYNSAKITIYLGK